MTWRMYYALNMARHSFFSFCYIGGHRSRNSHTNTNSTITCHLQGLKSQPRAFGRGGRERALANGRVKDGQALIKNNLG